MAEGEGRAHPARPLREAVSLRSGRRLRYLVGGEGPPLVLCHGWNGSAENFETWFAALAAMRTVVIPDLPGFGASEALPPPLRHTSATLAGNVLNLVDELGLGEFDLGGLCLGASVAQAMVRRRPAAVGRLLLHTPLVAPELVRRRFQVQARLFTTPGIWTAVRLLSRRRWISDLYKRLLVEGEDVDNAAAEANFENQRRAAPRAMREWLRDALGRDDRDLLAARGTRPTLILAAADDSIADVERLRLLAAGYPQLHLAVIDDAGHGWNAEYVSRQLTVITAFLAGRTLPATPTPRAA